MLSASHPGASGPSSNRDNRLKLLASILDTEEPTNKEYQFESQNEDLFEKVLYLVRSLGFAAHKTEDITNTYECNGNICKFKKIKQFKIQIRGKISSIPVKTNIFAGVNDSFEDLREDFSMTNVGEGEYFGFNLDGNGRYVLGDFSVTHNTGKSFCIASILYEKSHIFPVSLIMNGTEDSNHFYENLGFPSTFIYNTMDTTKLEEFIKRQKAAKDHLPNPWAALVIDDCMDDSKLFNDPTVQYLYKNGRHIKMFFILGLQYALDIKPTIRVNIDGAFIFRESNMKFRKALWENYAGIIPDFATFNTFMDELTDDRTALYIHNTGTSNKVEDCVFYYKAKEVPKDFKFGSKDYWDFHNARYNTGYDSTKFDGYRR